MVPWTRVQKLSTQDSVESVRQKVRRQRFSHLPVVKAETGRPIGYLLVKDLIGHTAEQGEWTTLVRPLIEISVETDIGTALQTLQSHSTTICVITERGKAVGVLTVEDILEQVIGRIGDDETPQTPKRLAELLITDTALLHLAGRTAEQVIAEMTARAPAERLPPGVNIAELAMERERQMSTDVGFGVAIPHARCPRLTAPFVIFGRAPDGVTWETHGTVPVRLIFLLVTPIEHPDLQVDLLSQVAAIVGIVEMRKALLEAKSAEQVLSSMAATE